MQYSQQCEIQCAAMMSGVRVDEEKQRQCGCAVEMFGFVLDDGNEVYGAKVV